MASSRAIGHETCTTDECDGGAVQAQAVQSSSLLQAGTSKRGKAASCTDYTAQYHGYDNKKINDASDKDGDRCGFYAGQMRHECGNHDDEDFIANEMCCNCGGGSTSMAPRSLAVNAASVFLSESSNCPSGFAPITTLAACRAALDLVGLPGHDYNGADSEGNWPKGCYLCDKVQGCGNGVWFNRHSTGQTVTGTRRFCHQNYNPADVGILFAGDSDIDYWDSAVAFPGSFNVGIGGYTTADVIKEVDQWVADLNPKTVVLVCGENDIDGTKQQTLKALKRFKVIVGKFIADGSRVIYVGTKPEPGTTNLHKQYMVYDAEIRKFASALAKTADTPPFQMIDVFRSFTSKSELYNSDRLHMSRMGYSFWNAWVKLAMADASCIRWMDGACMETKIVRYDR